MTTTTRTYSGDLSGGTVALPTRQVAFTAGEPVEFTDDEVGLLAPEWDEPKTKKASAKAKDTDTAPTGATTKEA